MKRESRTGKECKEGEGVSMWESDEKAGERRAALTLADAGLVWGLLRETPRHQLCHHIPYIEMISHGGWLVPP